MDEEEIILLGIAAVVVTPAIFFWQKTLAHAIVYV